jgi:DNA repair protein SbcC/Rad50
VRFSSIRARGLGPFREEVFVDFDALDAKLVAICGPNGAGKTTMLELLAASMFRECPTRGALSSLATTRDAFLEVGVVNGASHRLRHIVDAVSGKGEAVVTDDAGKPLVSSAKLREFDAWVSKHLPPPEVVYTSTFSAQSAGGFLEMRPAERKSVLLRLLGIERLEVLAEKARAHVKATREAIAVLNARIADERARASDPAKVQEEIDLLHVERSALSDALKLARAELDEATAAEQLARIARQDIDAHFARRTELTSRLTIATAKKSDVDTRIANNRAVLDRAAEIRAAQVRAVELDEAIAKHTESLAEARAAHAAASEALRAATEKRAVLARQSAEAERRLLVAKGRLADRPIVEKAVADLPKLRERVEDADVAVTSTEVKVEEAQALAMNGATTRIDGLREGLMDIAAGRDRAPADHAADTIYADDTLAAKAAEAPALVVAERDRLREARAALDDARALLSRVERIAARASEMEAAEADRLAAEREIGDVTKALAALRPLSEFEAEVEGPASGVVAFDKALQQAKADRAALAPTIALAEHLTQAEARLSAYAPQVEALAAEIAALTADLDGLGDLPEDVELPDLDKARSKVDAAVSRLSGNEAAIAVKTAQLADARATTDRIAKLRAELTVLDSELSDLVKLADDLGKDGVQALLLDAAGPEITEITNHLLHEAFGPRFTVRFDTVKRASNGKKDLEAFDVRVIDTVEGRDADGETYSGGERVILNEAISLALTTLGCRRAGVTGCSLVRDESGAALDGDRARAYVAMLRRAAELIGARQVLLVTHSDAVKDLCDARIEIGDRKVTVTS